MTSDEVVKTSVIATNNSSSHYQNSDYTIKLDCSARKTSDDDKENH